MEKTLANIRLIVVHAGKSSHQDERVAAAIARAAGARAPVVRRDPTEAELADANILVLDVGGQHNPALNNFDHHQLPREAAPACAYSLLAEHLGIDGKLAALFPWYTTGKSLDSKGPFSTAKACGAEWSKIQGFYGPDTAWLADAWAESEGLREEVTQRLADRIERKLDLYDAGVVAAAANTERVGEIVVLRLDRMAAEYAEISDCLAGAVGANVIVFNDDRGDGLGILRLNDDPRLDFSKWEGKEGIVFAHKGGFIVKTAASVKAEPDGVARIIRGALVA